MDVLKNALHPAATMVLADAARAFVADYLELQRENVLSADAEAHAQRLLLALEVAPRTQATAVELTNVMEGSVHVVDAAVGFVVAEAADSSDSYTTAARAVEGRVSWIACRITAELITRDVTTVLPLLTSAFLTHVLVRLGAASGCEDVADAFAAAQVVLYALYRASPSHRSAIRLGLLLLLRLLAERVETAGDAADALSMRSVIRLVLPLLQGMRKHFEQAPAALDHVLLQLIAPPIVAATRAPQAFDAFGSAAGDLFVALLDQAPTEDDEAALATELVTVLCEEYGGPMAHFRSAAVLRLIGRLLSTLSLFALHSVLQGLEGRASFVEVLGKALRSDLAAVALAAIAACSEGLLLSPVLQEAHSEHGDALLLVIATGLMGDKHALHWDIEVTLAMGRLWQELSTACGDRWQRAVEAAGAERRGLSKSSAPHDTSGASPAETASEVQSFGAALLSKCGAVEAARTADMEAATRDLALAEVELSSRTDFRHLNFVFGRDVGNGAFSVVKFAKYIQREVPQGHWLPVAIKFAFKAVAKTTPEGEAALAREVQLHRLLTNDPAARTGIARLYNTFSDPHHVHMVMELCPNGDLYTAVLATPSARHATGFWARGAAGTWLRTVLWDVAHTISEIHSGCGIMIGDIKPENVLIAANGRGKLADFGSAMALDAVSRAQAFGGTPHYSAPEVLLYTGYHPVGGTPSIDDGAACDWWSFALMVVHLLTGSLPFDADGPASLRQRAAQIMAVGDLEQFWKSAIPEWSSGAVPLFARRILLEASPRNRSGAAVWSWITDDAYFADCPPPYLAPHPRMPAHLHAAAATSTRNSGRKQSVMWRRHAVSDALMPASAWAVDVLAGDTVLPSEGPEDVPAFDPVVFELPVSTSSAALRRRGAAAASGTRPTGPIDLSSYMTTRPPLRR